MSGPGNSDTVVADIDHQRKRLEAEIEAHLDEAHGKIAELDALDGDPDLEDAGGGDDEADLEPDDDGEATLGWSANVGQINLGHSTEDGDETALERYGSGFIPGGGDDVEDDDPGGGDINDEPQFDDSDLEPSLASPENPEGDQTRWAIGEASDYGEGGDSIEEAPAVLEAARVRAYAERDRTVAAGREAERQLAELRGADAPFAQGSNVRVVIVGPDARRYGVTRPW